MNLLSVCDMDAATRARYAASVTPTTGDIFVMALRLFVLNPMAMIASLVVTPRGLAHGVKSAARVRTLLRLGFYPLRPDGSCYCDRPTCPRSRHTPASST